MRFLLGIMMVLWATISFAGLKIPIYSTDNAHTLLGTVKADDTVYGLLLTPKLHDLPPGTHGFHVHEGAFCSNHGMAAGHHLDPEDTKQHKGPYAGSGHLGDLPILVVDDNGDATSPILAPRLKLENIEGHSLMIHAGSDNYSDKPQKLGGGGERIACGVIPYY